MNAAGSDPQLAYRVMLGRVEAALYSAAKGSLSYRLFSFTHASVVNAPMVNSVTIAHAPVIAFVFHCTPAGSEIMEYRARGITRRRFPAAESP